ncbi:MAG: hypothetical protein WCP22_03230 [Chlamydiota bacterium]
MNEKDILKGRAIWDALSVHRDPKKPITATAISKAIFPVAGYVRSRKVRDIIRDMTINGSCPLPVVGSGKGFYVSQDPELVQEYADNLYHLSIEIFNRRKGVLETACRCGVLSDGPEEQMEMVLL